MDRKKLFGIIVGITLIVVIVIVILELDVRYNKLVVNNSKWNSITSSRGQSSLLYFKNIEFNDYNLLIDNDNSVIYYSIVDSMFKYNPSIKYMANQKVNVVINQNMTDDELEDGGNLQVMLYNDTEYRIYKLIATNYSILNVIYDENQVQKNKISCQIDIFDNHVETPQHVLKSDGKFNVIKNGEMYSLSLTKESLGNNKRENHISIFGMDKKDEYFIKKVGASDSTVNHVRLFINNKYVGIYSFSSKEGRKNENFERNRENNK